MHQERRKRAIRLLTEELPSIQNKEAIDHYNKLLSVLNSSEDSKKRIMIFQPCAAGDIFCSQWCAELFQIKYPNCSVTFMTETPEVLPVLGNNPFIDNVIFFKTMKGGWEKIFTDHKAGMDYAYALYWWTPPIMKSFLEDLELPTDYQRIHLYKHDDLNGRAKKAWGTATDFKIAVQADISRSKWGGDRDKLVQELQKRGTVRLIGPAEADCGAYLASIEMLREADVLICAHGSQCHAANAVGIQTIELSTRYPSDWVSPAFIHNKYRSTTRQSMVIQPERKCKGHSCVFNDVAKCHAVSLPAIFPKNRFTPQMGDCTMGLSKGCSYEIPMEKILEHLDRLIELRKKEIVE